MQTMSDHLVPMGLFLNCRYSQKPVKIQDLLNYTHHNQKFLKAMKCNPDQNIHYPYIDHIHLHQLHNTQHHHKLYQDRRIRCIHLIRLLNHTDYHSHLILSRHHKHLHNLLLLLSYKYYHNH